LHFGLELRSVPDKLVLVDEFTASPDSENLDALPNLVEDTVGLEDEFANILRLNIAPGLAAVGKLAKLANSS
jgi:hypothetical protein